MEKKNKLLCYKAKYQTLTTYFQKWFLVNPVWIASLYKGRGNKNHTIHFKLFSMPPRGCGDNVAISVDLFPGCGVQNSYAKPHSKKIILQKPNMHY